MKTYIYWFNSKAIVVATFDVQYNEEMLVLLCTVKYLCCICPCCAM